MKMYRRLAIIGFTYSLSFIGVECLQGECFDIKGRTIAPGLHYVPGPDTCTLCVCDNGHPKWCKAVLCSPPQDCKSFRVGNSCCEFICLDETLGKVEGPHDINTDVGLRLIAGAITAILSLSILFFGIHRLRQRKIRGRQNQLHDEEGSIGFIAGSLRYLPSCEYEEPPVHYSLWKPPGNYFPRGEAPPPYEEAVAAARVEAALAARVNPANTAPGPSLLIHAHEHRTIPMTLATACPLSSTLIVNEPSTVSGSANHPSHLHQQHQPLPPQQHYRESSSSSSSSAAALRHSAAVESQIAHHSSMRNQLVAANAANTSSANTVHYENVETLRQMHPLPPVPVNTQAPLSTIVEASVVNTSSPSGSAREGGGPTSSHNEPCSREANSRVSSGVQPPSSVMNNNNNLNNNNNNNSSNMASIAEENDDYRSECENCNLSAGGGSQEYFLDDLETMTLHRRPHEVEPNPPGPFYRTSLTLPTNCRRTTSLHCTTAQSGARENWFSSMPESSTESSEEE